MDSSPPLKVKEISPKEKIDLVISPSMLQIARSNFPLYTRFQENPKVTNEQVVKRIFRYLKGTIDFGLWYKKGGYFMLKAYIDANWSGSVDDQKSTSGGAFFRRQIGLLFQKET